MLRLLLDTNVLLWWLSKDPKLGKQTAQSIKNGKNDVFVSAVSVWEIAIKSGKGKLKMSANLQEGIDKSGFEPLHITLFHAQQAGNLPMHHKDPFDRMIVAQAQAEGLVIVTDDKTIPLYGVRTLTASE